MNRFFLYIALGTAVYMAVQQLVTMIRAGSVSADAVWAVIFPVIISIESAFSINVDDTLARQIVDAAVGLLNQRKPA